MADDISDYHDAMLGMLLADEELEATFPAAVNVAPDSDDPKALAITTHRLIVCYRRLRTGTYDRWRMRTIGFARIDEVELLREEDLRREKIETTSSIVVHLARQTGSNATMLELRYRDPVLAREIHDRILTHVLR